MFNKEELEKLLSDGNVIREEILKIDSQNETVRHHFSNSRFNGKFDQ